MGSNKIFNKTLNFPMLNNNPTLLDNNGIRTIHSNKIICKT